MANSFVKNVTTAGTAERISASTILVSSVTFRAKKGNTNDIYLGDADVANTYPDLDANQTITFEAPMYSGNHLLRWIRPYRSIMIATCLFELSNCVLARASISKNLKILQGTLHFSLNSQALSY